MNCPMTSNTDLINSNPIDSSDTNEHLNFSFESFVDPSMLLPCSENDLINDLMGDDLLSFGALSAENVEAPTITTTATNTAAASNAAAANTLYEKLMASPPTFPGSPYLNNCSPNSPSTLMMATEPSWMHSSKPRRRRSTYASPSMNSAYFPPPASPYMAPGIFTTSPSMQMQNIPSLPTQYYPAMPSMMYHPSQHAMMMAPMSPMNVTVKLPMAPLSGGANGGAAANPGTVHGGTKGHHRAPLMLPVHLQRMTVNSAAPNVSLAEESKSASQVASEFPSRCSSTTPSCSVSQVASMLSSASTFGHRWFTEMTATKDSFLQDEAKLDYANVTVLELKQILRKFGLNSTGKKVQLQDRIKEIASFLRNENDQERRKRNKIANNDCNELKSEMSIAIS